MNLARLFRINARPFKHCLNFIYRRKNYATGEINPQELFEVGPKTKKSTVKTHKWILEQWYWKQMISASGSLAKTTRRLKTSSKLLPTWLSSLLRYLLLILVYAAFCFMFCSDIVLVILFMLSFMLHLIPCTIFYSICLIVQFLFFFSFGIPVFESSGYNEDKCVQTEASRDRDMHINRGNYMAREEIRNFSSSVERTSEIFFQREKGKFVSPSGHVMLYLLYKHQWNTKPFHFNRFLVWKARFIM